MKRWNIIKPISNSLRLSICGLTGILVLLVCLSGCIKVETGQTAEEATESSEQKARRMRVDWAERLMDASPIETGRIFTAHVDTMCLIYFDYGFKVANQWEDGNQQRGSEIPAVEMLEMVSRWNETMEPVLKANEDNAEYGYESLERSQYFDDSGLEKFRLLLNLFYQIRSDVFYPAGSVESYRERIYQNQHELENLSPFVPVNRTSGYPALNP